MDHLHAWLTRAPSLALPYPEGIDPAAWRSRAELAGLSRAIEEAETRAAGIHPKAVASEEDLERATRADREGAERARGQASWHQGQVESLRASEPGLAAQARADFAQARADAGVIAAGPGRLGRRSAQADQARARRAEVARRWSIPEARLPKDAWLEVSVAGAADRVAKDHLAPAISDHRAQARAEEDTARTLQARADSRRLRHISDQGYSQAQARQRQALLEGAKRARKELTQARQVRAQALNDLSPEVMALADAARDVHRGREAAQARTKEQARLRGPSHDLTRDRGMDRGPSLGR